MSICRYCAQRIVCARQGIAAHLRERGAAENSPNTVLDERWRHVVLNKGDALQVGPRKSFATAWSANAASICASCGLLKVMRLEASRRFRLRTSAPLSEADAAAFAALVHDRMTEQVGLRVIDCFRQDSRLCQWPASRQGPATSEHHGSKDDLAPPWHICYTCSGLDRILHDREQVDPAFPSSRCLKLHICLPLQVYDEPLTSFASDMEPGPVITVPVMEQGRKALEDISQVGGAALSWSLALFLSSPVQSTAAGGHQPGARRRLLLIIKHTLPVQSDCRVCYQSCGAAQGLPQFLPGRQPWTLCKLLSEKWVRTWQLGTARS